MSTLPLTNKTNDLIAEAQDFAMSESHSQLTPLHVFYALLCKDSDQLCRKIITKIGKMSFDEVSENVTKAVSKLPKQTPAPDVMSPSSALTRVLRVAGTDAKAAGDSHIAIDHLLIALSKDSSISPFLKTITTKDIEGAVTSMRSGRPVDSAHAENSYDALNKYAIGKYLVSSLLTHY